LILPKERDPRFVTIRRGRTLTDSDHHLLALWAASCAEGRREVGAATAVPGVHHLGVQRAYRRVVGGWLVHLDLKSNVSSSI
jgi:hypothetical protein